MATELGGLSLIVESLDVDRIGSPIGVLNKHGFEGAYSIGGRKGKVDGRLVKFPVLLATEKTTLYGDNWKEVGLVEDKYLISPGEREMTWTHTNSDGRQDNYTLNGDGQVTKNGQPLGGREAERLVETMVSRAKAINQSVGEVRAQRREKLRQMSQLVEFPSLGVDDAGRVWSKFDKAGNVDFIVTYRVGEVEEPGADGHVMVLPDNCVFVEENFLVPQGPEDSGPLMKTRWEIRPNKIIRTQPYGSEPPITIAVTPDEVFFDNQDISNAITAPAWRSTLVEGAKDHLAKLATLRKSS